MNYSYVTWCLKCLKLGNSTDFALQFSGLPFTSSSGPCNLSCFGSGFSEHAPVSPGYLGSRNRVLEGFLMKSLMGTWRYCGKSTGGRITCFKEEDDQEGCLSEELLFFFLDGHWQTFSLALSLFFRFNFSPKLIFGVRIGACNQL